MKGKFIAGITTGAVLGAAVGVMMMPEMDRSTRRRLRKSGKMVRNTAQSFYNTVKDMMPY